MNRTIIIILILFTGLVSCSRTPVEFSSWRDLQSYIYNPSNGATVFKEVFELRIGATYMPEELVNARLGENSNQDEPRNAKHLAFLLTIKSNDVENASLAQFAYVSDQAEYKERVQWLNFEMENLMHLQLGEKSIKSSLCILESNIDDHSKLSFYIVFPLEETESISNSETDDIILTFDDRIFFTGLNNLVFSTKRIQEISEFKVKS